MPDDSELLAVLESLRERGALGELSLPRAVAHAEAFLEPISSTARRLIDLGSGGGLPGLVLAVRRPALDIVLTDRRERRGDLLRLACSQLGVVDRVSVVVGDVVALGKRSDFAGQFDAVTARAFGEPLWTVRCAERFLTASGVIVVSEPPDAESSIRWPSADVARLGLTVVNADRTDRSPVRVLQRLGT